MVLQNFLKKENKERKTKKDSDDEYSIISNIFNKFEFVSSSISPESKVEQLYLCNIAHSNNKILEQLCNYSTYVL